MKLKLLFLCGLFFPVLLSSSYSQIIVDSKAIIANVDFKLINKNELIINYDLLDAKPSEKFIITVKIITEAGKQISAKSFKGDVGENISGGTNKYITWTISDDIAYLDDKINVEVIATQQNPQIIQPTNKGKAILLSTILPGLGSAKISLRNWHIIKGIAAYGSIAGSFYLSNKSRKSYSDYQNAGVTTERDRLYNQSVKEDQTSRVLLYAAGAMWIIDYATILLSENRSQKKGFRSQIVYFGPALYPGNNYKGMSMIVNF
jgi:hypothetical protein